ncbi:MAG: hypothetical protein LBI53_03220 [Candidatus Peribacteria bacterium]|jgi:predicted  nucleic acid-binding Zn-ribbon protein|nr:hypothetical protein [Candidatus Peribacteria bacterium]
MVVNTDNTPENNVETSKGFTLEGLSNQVTKVSEQVSEVSNEVTNVKNQARALEEDVATLSTKKQAEQVSADVIGNIEN